MFGKKILLVRNEETFLVNAIKNALLFASYKIGFVGTSNGFMTEEQIETWHALIWKDEKKPLDS